jgi:hypothetical protein
MLSDVRHQDAFSAVERALIDRLLPWTRTLGADDTASAELVDFCREHRRDLILKPHGGHGGVGILAGWETTDREWAAALTGGRGHGYVVQRRVVPRTEPVVDPGTGQVVHYAAVWDAFITPHGYAGSHIRALPADGPGVINMGASGAARTTSVFYYPDPAER